MELANHTPYPVKVYANEGIAQILFHRGDECNTTYADREGKYQNQASEVTHSRV
jgi:dCTP deaminase